MTNLETFWGKYHVGDKWTGVLYFICSKILIVNDETEELLDKI
jgi:hypothetical protein